MRTLKQEQRAAKLARDAMLYGFLYPYIEERHRRRAEHVQHDLDLAALLYFVAKFIVEACIAGLTYDAIKRVLMRTFRKNQRVSLYELGSIDHESPAISIGRRKIGTITMSEALQERMLQEVMQHLSARSKKKALGKLPPLEKLPPPFPIKKNTRKKVPPKSARKD